MLARPYPTPGLAPLSWLLSAQQGGLRSNFGLNVEAM